MQVTLKHTSWPAWTALRAARWNTGGGTERSPGGWREENRRCGRARSGREISSGKSWEGTKGFRLGNLGGMRIDSETTTRECVESSEIREGRRWVVLRSGWNEESRARGHNTQDRVKICKRTMSGQVRKGTGVGRVIRIASLNIRLGKSGELEAAFWALQQGNVGVGFAYTPKIACDTPSGKLRRRVDIR